MKKAHYIVCSKYRKTEKTKISYISKLYQVFLLFAVSVKIKIKNDILKKTQLKY